MLDVGMVGTEMLYWTVGSRELDGGLMCTASHNPKAYTGAKLVKQRRARAVRRLGHRRAARHGHGRRAGRPGRPARRDRDRGHRRRVPRERRSASSTRSADPADEGRARRRQRDGRADGRADPRRASRSSRCRPTGSRTATSPTTSRTRCSGEPPASSSRRSLSEGAELGIAWDGDADRCFFIDDTGQFVDGDFLTALLAESILAQGARARRSSTTCAPRARCATSSRRAGGHALREPRGPRLLQDAHARDGRGLRRRGVGPLLLPRLLLRRLRHASPRC